jgi:NAD-dependent SIR2 family protein deacetylase
MRRASFAILLCAALFLPATQAAGAQKKSMAEKGSYHRIHEQKEKLDCTDCHAKKPLPDNTLKLRLHQPLAKDSPGPVSSDSCHECHGKKQKKRVTWYAPKKVQD